ncbi:hypothetical protein B0H21DRAFT_816102 [Amylocystis lapponica]|nr:hypothetical protein B0H21DRAFT_816102 [Amylocystis lapponica]
MAICQFCRVSFKSDLAVRQHQVQSTSRCHQKYNIWWKELWMARRARRTSLEARTSAHDLSIDAMDVDGPESNISEDISHLAATYGEEKLPFQAVRDEQILCGAEIHGPFQSEEEWELAKWLIKNVGHTQAEKFLKLPIVQTRVKPSFHNKDAFLGAIDTLPSGVDWQCQDIQMTGDVPDQDGNLSVEHLELWFRNPLECIRELLSNPAFKDVLKYAPERHFADKNKDAQVTSEMWTGEWWWDLQQRLPEGATIAPVILSSDKTKLSQFRGDKSAWPVYLTIGNIAKDVRRKASSHATVLVAYLPVPKLDCFGDKTRPAVKYQLFHHCMKTILATVASAGRTGKEMACADGFVRAIWPIIAAYVADYPEQCLVACCMENRCPMCQVPPDQRGAHVPHAKRDMQETLSLLADQSRGTETPETKARFKELGLRRILPPFWHDLPFADVFRWFTPDLLHQLHKGVFKDHLVKWTTALVGEDELDARFRSMSGITGLRHFSHGISMVSQWTGSEHKEMEKVFLGLVMGRVDDQVIRTIRAVIDFIYLASLQSHTTQTLAALRQALDDFHTHKHIFLELGARTQGHFNIPKIHSMEHYVALIELFGSADGFNTESPERLHIDYAKDAYRASNRKDYLLQMVVWLRRQEAVDRYSIYLEWCQRGAIDAQELVLASREDADSDDAAAATLVSPSANPSLPAVIQYNIPARHPPALRGISATDIIEHQQASRFLTSLQTFLRGHGSSFIPRTIDTFDLYARYTVYLPSIPATGSRHLKNIIRATPPVAAHGRVRTQPAHLDFALVRTGEINQHTAGTPLEGLRVAHVRVIFSLPHHYPKLAEHPLAYVEWFTPLARLDPASGLYLVSPSTRMHAPYGEVITLDRLVRNCHLTPNFGREADSRWTTDNVTEECRSFYLNPYSDMHMFCTFRAHQYGCL